ncbi:hypothetical protein FB107DRAFT_276039 [Schizophyllum commune]
MTYVSNDICVAPSRRRPAWAPSEVESADRQPLGACSLFLGEQKKEGGGTPFAERGNLCLRLIVGKESPRESACSLVEKSGEGRGSTPPPPPLPPYLTSRLAFTSSARYFLPAPSRRKRARVSSVKGTKRAAVAVDCIPQIYLDLLTHSHWSIARTSLIIFDECYRVQKNDPYRQIMDKYRHCAPALRPRVLGLTAPPVWDVRNPGAALAALEAKLDALVVGVRRHAGELDAHTARPHEVIKTYGALALEEVNKGSFPVGMGSCMEVFDSLDWEGVDTPGLAMTSNPAAYATLLENRNIHARYYVLRHNDSTTTTVTDFALLFRLRAVASSAVTLGGRQSKLVITDYAFGDLEVLYSTSQVFSARKIDGRDVLSLHGDITQEHELTIQLTDTPNKIRAEADSRVVQTPLASLVNIVANGLDMKANSTSTTASTIITIPRGISCLIIVNDSDTQLVLFAVSPTAATFWAPTLAGPQDDPFRHFWSLWTNETVLVGGPRPTNRWRHAGGFSGEKRGDEALPWHANVYKMHALANAQQTESVV